MQVRIFGTPSLKALTYKEPFESMLVRNGQNSRLSTTSEAKQDLLQERKLCDSVRQRYHYGTTDPEEVAQSALFRSG